VTVPESTSLTDREVALWKIQRVMGAISILQDCRSFSSFVPDDYAPLIGSIVARLPGYFTGANNTGFTSVILPTSWRWQKCDGRSFYDARSPLFNKAGRYLPMLTDARFLMGSTSPGSIGGANSFTLVSANLPKHTHTVNHTHDAHGHSPSSGANSHNHYSGLSAQLEFGIYGGSSPGAGQATIHVSGGSGAFSSSPYTNTETHNHTLYENTASPSYSGSSGDGGFANSSVSNLPKYLSVEYFMRVA